MREFCLVGMGFLSGTGGIFVQDGWSLSGGVFVLGDFVRRGFCLYPEGRGVGEIRLMSR